MDFGFRTPESSTKPAAGVLESSTAPSSTVPRTKPAAWTLKSSALSVWTPSKTPAALPATWTLKSSALSVCAPHRPILRDVDG
ncbi:MAG: hypothetical protein K6E40_03230 [Desulfovibrio sp.]|nr:hypothetical protein [Desulfovibrio sp.]